ncbi:MAG: UDP-N-acetylmuramoyl-L-alanine--D-glutamate ligase, partial [Candidatus Binatia bacterium]
VPVDPVPTLDAAVVASAACAEPGDTVLLAPACSSFDEFTDYAARGQAFRAAIEALSHEEGRT